VLLEKNSSSHKAEAQRESNSVNGNEGVSKMHVRLVEHTRSLPSAKLPVRSPHFSLLHRKFIQQKFTENAHQKKTLEAELPPPALNFVD
jgi:hypothetical protein